MKKKVTIEVTIDKGHKYDGGIKIDSDLTIIGDVGYSTLNRFLRSLFDLDKVQYKTYMEEEIEIVTKSGDRLTIDNPLCDIKEEMKNLSAKKATKLYVDRVLNVIKEIDNFLDNLEEDSHSRLVSIELETF